MPVFSKKIPDTPRFSEDFRIEPDPADPGNQAQQDYVAALNGAVDHLANNEKADVAANYPAGLLTERRRARAAAAAALEVDADNFIAGRNPGADVARINEILANYAAQIPKFGARPASQPRFAGDLDVITVTGYMPTKPELSFLDSIATALREFQADEKMEPASQFSMNVKSARRQQRIGTSERLIREIENFGANGKTAEAAVVDVILLRGRYQALRDRLTRRLFNVKFEKNSLGKSGAKVDVGKSNSGSGGKVAGQDDQEPDDDRVPAILEIRLLGDLPPPEDKASPEKLELYAQISKTNTVIRTVCERLQERASRRSGLAMIFEGVTVESDERVRKLHLEFLNKLHGVAVVGLELNFVDVAKSTLAELRAEFFALEAGRVKSAHSNGLALVAFLSSAILLAFYAVISLNGCYDIKDCTNSWFFDHKNFLLAACGAAIGTWASFTYRQVEFTFENLMMLEERSSAPSMRILFVVVLTMAACLLFWNSAINIDIGNLSTAPQTFKAAGTVAFLIGLFCGLAERGLATAIAGRAAAFVKGVGAG